MDLPNEQKLQEKIDGLEEELRNLKLRLQEKRQLEEQLIQAQKMESLANLAAGIAHDFNNILQTILGYTQLALLGIKAGVPQEDAFQKIERIVHKGSELTEQFLTFGRKKLPNFASLDLNQKARDLANLLRRTIPKMIEIDLQLSDDLKAIHADGGQIEQVLMNLCINAKDAMPQGGRLVIRTENIELKREHPLMQLSAHPGEYVLLSVSDTGGGIPPENLKHIYEPFFTTKDQGKGTGLGLAVVYAIVKNHEGFIECSSQMGEGTTFRIRFPALPPQPEPPEPGHGTAANQGSGESGSETVLLVEDDADILKTMKEILQTYGYRVVTAENGEKAVELYSAKAIDLVVLDVSMPGMGGMRCLQELLSLDQDAKVIISTGYPSNGPIRHLTERQTGGFLAKPYPFSELLAMVRKTLDKEVYYQTRSAVSPSPEILPGG
jgi:two-component system cell cycle sensor histidine kinase/response regulator CckA